MAEDTKTDIVNPLDAPANPNLDMPEATDADGKEIEADKGAESVTETAPMDSPVASDSSAPGSSPDEEKAPSDGAVLASAGKDGEGAADESAKSGDVPAPLDAAADTAAEGPSSESSMSTSAETVPSPSSQADAGTEKPADADKGSDLDPKATAGESDAVAKADKGANASADVSAPSLDGVHAEAAPIEEATDTSVMDGFKEAGNALYPAMTKIGEEFQEAVAKLEGEAAARFANLRDKANHFLAALEAVFSRK